MQSQVGDIVTKARLIQNTQAYWLQFLEVLGFPRLIILEIRSEQLF